MNRLFNLEGRVALVTGGSRGIGRACVEALATAGADLVVNYRSRADDAESVAETVRSIGRSALVVGADVAAREDVDRLVAACMQRYGRVDILVNNAGIGVPCALEEITDAQWDETLAVNLKSVFMLTRAIVPLMRSNGWGRIINMSSAAVQLGGVVGPHYTASKAGVIGLTHSIAQAVARDGITVNCICPALVETDMLRAATHIKPDPIPMKRFGSVAECAEVVVMLAANGYMTGQTICFNGGWYMT